MLACGVDVAWRVSFNLRFSQFFFSNWPTDESLALIRYTAERCLHIRNYIIHMY